MNKTIIGIAISLLLIFSCGQRKEIKYNTYVSPDKSYSIEIPSNAVKGKCLDDFMSFQDKESGLIVSVKRVEESSIDEHIHTDRAVDGGFTHTLYHSSDTSYFYKITRGNSMWSAYELYMLKRLNGKYYIIQVSSDKIGQSEIVKMIEHIQASMKQNIMDKLQTTTNESAQKTYLESSYSNRYYALKYPKGWKIIEHLDAMTDVYIGSESDNFGFTILRFETDYCLSEINAEGNAGIKQAGVKIREDKLITVNGIKCYRAIHEINMQNQKVKHISYTFKKDNMLYNIKFGSVTTKAQEALATEIMKSFYLK